MSKNRFDSFSKNRTNMAVKVLEDTVGKIIAGNHFSVGLF